MMTDVQYNEARYNAVAFVPEFHGDMERLLYKFGNFHLQNLTLFFKNYTNFACNFILFLIMSIT